MTIYIAYFLFIIYEVDYHLQLSSTAYSDLGVPITASESDIQSRFRKLTVRYHPDKIAARGADNGKATEFYVHLKHMRDIVMDPAKRFAYDRFGPESISKCNNCLTIKEYTWHALGVTLVTYGALAAFLLGSNALGFLKDGAYWRYLSLLAVATYEVRTALRPDHPPFLESWLNPLLVMTGTRPAYLPFQLTAVVRKASLSAAQFLGLLIPLWRDDPHKRTKSTEDSEEARHQQIDRLENAVRETSMHASRLVDLEATPYKQNERAKGDLKEAMKKYMLQNAVHMDRDVRNAMGQSYARRRAGVPHGAQGNK